MKAREMLYSFARSRLMGRMLATLSPDVKRAGAEALKRTSGGLRLKGALAEGERLANADACLVSFPKCGRTWLRVMLGRAFQLHFRLEDVNLLELYRLTDGHPAIPRIYVTHDDAPRKKPSELVVSKKKYKHVKVILLIRDPRDVVVSFYFQLTKRAKKYEGDLSTFLHEERGSLETILRFYNIWAENRHLPRGFLMVRYEDLHADAHKELRRIFDFLDLPSVTEEVVAEAVSYASFENMRKIESRDSLHSHRLRPGNSGDPDSFKTRRGEVGGFVAYFTDEEVQYLNRRVKEGLSSLYGYNS